MPHCFDGGTLPFLAANDLSRAADITAGATRGGIVWAARGGYGCARILELLDWKKLQQCDFKIAGFSDITALHWAMTARHAGTAVAAPMLKFLSEMDDDLSIKTLNDALESRPVSLQLTALHGNHAGGLALPGNLTVAASLAGSKFFPDTTGRIIVLEDVGEAPYRIDRALTQLQLAGAFEKCAGVIFGYFTNCGDVTPVLENFAANAQCPVFTGLPFGHEMPFYSLATTQYIEVQKEG
jgi:muramoyltetrapeptide carboxypeptidase